MTETTTQTAAAPQTGSQTAAQTATEIAIAQTERAAASNYAPVPLVLTEGNGATVTDIEGNTYLDFLGGFSTMLFGHRPPRITAAAHAQLDRLTLTARAFYNDELAACVTELTELTGFERVLLMNTGAEAIETAIKGARKWAHENRDLAADEGVIITFSRNFHGRTTTIISGSDDPVAREGYGPYTPGFVTVPFGDMAAVREVAAASPVVAVLIEPVQGEAGVILPPEGFLQALRAFTAENNIVFIADEVQSGMGRTGKLFATEHFGIRPDLISVGKVLSGGILPVSAVLGDSKFLGVFTPGSHGSTFGGSPFACAVTRSVVAELRGPDFLPGVVTLGGVLSDALAELAELPEVTAVRSIGLWAGVDIDPEFAPAKAVAEALRDRGVLVKDTQGKTLRMAPPAVATEAEIREAIRLLGESIASLR